MHLVFATGYRIYGREGHGKAFSPLYFSFELTKLILTLCYILIIGSAVGRTIEGMWDHCGGTFRNEVIHYWNIQKNSRQ